MKFSIFFLAVITLMSCDTNPPQKPTHQSDVLAYGGTSSAITAAVQITKMGKAVVIGEKKKKKQKKEKADEKK
ncbi:MAG: hypothetical protein U5K79_10640 [Cyclobacteriaceae bacterium]|nr:hypothetical protein [Cyclobacteriaceae bacterium]